MSEPSLSSSQSTAELSPAYSRSPPSTDSAPVIQPLESSHDLDDVDNVDVGCVPDLGSAPLDDCSPHGALLGDVGAIQQSLAHTCGSLPTESSRQSMCRSVVDSDSSAASDPAGAAQGSLPVPPTLPELPPVQQCSAPAFFWGELSGEFVLQTLQTVYHEAVHWLPNIFTIPLGAVGKRFVDEVTRLLRGFAEGSALESVSFWAVMVMPLLLLQKPAEPSSHQLRVACLARRLDAWIEGRFHDLLMEARTLQIYLSRRRHNVHEHGGEDGGSSMSRIFARLMLQGKVKAALRILSADSRGRVLDLDESLSLCSRDGERLSVRDILKAKHPSGQPIVSDALVTSEPPPVHPVIYEKITGSTIRAASLHCQGSAGPSGLDAASWKRMCSLYHGSSHQLCNTIAAVARRLCSVHLEPNILQPFVACRLIPLSKNPGVRPIGVCETLRRIIGKSLMQVFGHDIQVIAGSSQLCAGQRAGCEAAVHAMNKRLEQAEVEGLLFVDASNAFNSLNRSLMLHNIHAICPSLATCVTNMYRGNAELFVGGETILSREGTTQGDPLSMAVYALATLPLIDKAKQADLVQTWFADDACAGASLTNLYAWWSVLREDGPMYGYFVNPPKTWLLVKEGHVSRAKELFKDLGIQITTNGRPLLGAPLGCDTFQDAFIVQQVDQWVSELQTLSTFAATQPHAAFTAFSHGLANKWRYLARACPSLEKHVAPIEAVIRRDFLPALTGRSISDLERELLALPARFGGLGLSNPTAEAPAASSSAAQITQPLVDHLLGKSELSAHETFAEQQAVHADVRRKRNASLRTEAKAMQAKLPARLLRAVVAAEDRGASNWLTALPLADHGFALSKADFRDAIHLRYGWHPPRLPSHCICGKDFSVDHSLSCSHGGYLGLRHNEVRDLLGDLLTDTCSNVCLEPTLQRLDGEEFNQGANTSQEARVDIKAGGFWNSNRHECAFFDVRVFHPHARSYLQTPLDRLYRQHEQEKRRLYGERIREVDRGSFTPLVFSSSGGAGPAASIFIKRLASLVAAKKEIAYSSAVGWLRCRLSFALLRSSILCLRGSRSPRRPASMIQEPDLALAESRLQVRE